MGRMHLGWADIPDEFKVLWNPINNAVQESEVFSNEKRAEYVHSQPAILLVSVFWPHPTPMIWELWRGWRFWHFTLWPFHTPPLYLRFAKKNYGQDMPKALVKYYFVASIIENHGSAALSLIGLSQTKYEAHFPNDFRIMCLIFLGSLDSLADQLIIWWEQGPLLEGSVKVVEM